MYDFDKVDNEYSLPYDIGGQAALNDLNRKMFDMFQGFASEDEAWADMRKSEFGAKLFEELTQFDEYEFNGSAKESEEE
jgi:hypothetical protein